MENGSLDTFLYGDKRGTLTWKQRVDIIMGTARGLAYIHEQFHVCIIHRDTSNILLDDDFEGQRHTKKLTPKQVTSLFKATCQRPTDRQAEIVKIFNSNTCEENPYAMSWQQLKREYYQLHGFNIMKRENRRSVSLVQESGI